MPHNKGENNTVNGSMRLKKILYSLGMFSIVLAGFGNAQRTDRTNAGALDNASLKPLPDTCSRFERVSGNLASCFVMTLGEKHIHAQDTYQCATDLLAAYAKNKAGNLFLEGLPFQERLSLSNALKNRNRPLYDLCQKIKCTGWDDAESVSDRNKFVIFFEYALWSEVYSAYKATKASYISKVITEELFDNDFLQLLKASITQKTLLTPVISGAVHNSGIEAFQGSERTEIDRKKLLQRWIDQYLVTRNFAAVFELERASLLQRSQQQLSDPSDNLDYLLDRLLDVSDPVNLKELQKRDTSFQKTVELARKNEPAFFSIFAVGKGHVSQHGPNEQMNNYLASLPAAEVCQLLMR